MDAGLKRGKMWNVLKTEEERLHSPTDSQSDTEIFAQERTYQHMNYLHKKRVSSLPQENRGNEDAKEDEAEEFQLYDSLEVAAHFQDEKNPSLFRTEYMETQTEDGGRTSQLLSGDAYSDLRYDPSWRTKLKGAGQFGKSPQISAEEHHPKLKDGNGPVIKGGYRYVRDTSQKFFHLHPQMDQIGSLTPPCPTTFTWQPRSPEAELRGLFRTQSESQTLWREKDEESSGGYGENIKSAPEITDDSQAAAQRRLQQEVRRATRGGTVQTPQTVPKVLPKKPGSVVKNIVESNKITLGRNTCKTGSYVRALAQMQETSQDGKKVHRSLKETASSQSSEESSPSRQTVHKTHEVGQISKWKKVQQKDLNASPLQQPPPPEFRAERGDGLTSPPAVTHQQMTSSQPPAVHLNIFLNSPSDLLPVLQQTGQDGIISLASLHSHIQSSPPEAVLSSAQQTNPETSHEVISASKCPLSCETESQRCSSETPMKEFVENLPETPTTSLSQASSPYPVLPPIRKVMPKKGSELFRGQGVNTAHPMRRGSSDSYLLQMEKQKQTRARATYKAYTLKDYKQLELDIKLQGLGPDYAAKQEAKMKRQRLYSNVIREQNKNISRIPFPATKDPEGNDNKVPRIKALEYAKTIAKPLASPSQSKRKQKPQPEGFEQTPSLDGFDASELATLELLRQRHLEERQAVALFRKVHPV